MSACKQYRYYVFDSFTGELLGTDSQEVAQHYALNEEDAVIDTHTGCYMLPDASLQPVKEASDLADQS